MTILIGMAICVIISMITSFFFPEFDPGCGAVSSLYTVSGIMFSIGMSLIVTFRAVGVKNPRIKKGIRKEIIRVRNCFICNFIIVSILYMIMYPAIEKQNSLIVYDIYLLKFSHLLIFIVIYSILYFIWNFLAIQRLNHQIEDTVEKETSI